MKILMRTFKEEYSDVEYAIVDITKEYLEELHARGVYLRLAHEKDNSATELLYRDASCEFYRDFTIEVEGGDTHDQLSPEERDKFEDVGWIRCPESLEIPEDSEVRTEIDRCNLLLLVSDEKMYVYWSCSPKHGSELVTSQEIALKDLEELLK